jgi:hypothetical protein
MMADKNGTSQIVKLVLTRLANIPLSIVVFVVMSTFLDVGRISVRTVNLFWY